MKKPRFTTQDIATIHKLWGAGQLSLRDIALQMKRKCRAIKAVLNRTNAIPVSCCDPATCQHKDKCDHCPDSRE